MTLIYNTILSMVKTKAQNNVEHLQALGSRATGKNKDRVNNITELYKNKDIKNN